MEMSEMRSRRPGYSRAIALITLISALDAGLIVYKYIADSNTFGLSNLSIAAGVYAYSFLIYLPIIAVAFAVSSLFLRKHARVHDAARFLIIMLVGLLILYQKQTRVLHYGNASEHAFIWFLLAFMLFMYLIRRMKRENLWLKILIAGNALLILFLAIPFNVSREDGGETHSSPDIVMIIVDTMRFDRLGCNGNTMGLTPGIDEVAERSRVYDNAYVHWPASGPSHSAMLTGKTVYEHKAFNGSKLGIDFTTLPEVLKENGYTTGGFVQNMLLNYKNNYDQGFDVFITDMITRFTNATRKVLVDHLLPVVAAYRILEQDRFTDEAIDWMNLNRGKKKFLFLQYFHPHIPYTPPSRFMKRSNYHGIINGSLDQSRKIRSGEMKVSPEDIQYMTQLYDEEIQYSDEQIRKVCEYLIRSGQFDNTILLITADHGENLFEHGKYFAHGNELYDSTVHIPLVVSFPNGDVKKEHVKKLFRDIDFMPLILDLSGIKFAGFKNGNNPYVNKDLEILGVTCNASQTLLYTKADTLKYILNMTTMDDELYNLRTDSRELENLCDADPKVCRHFREMILREVAENSLIGNFLAGSCVEASHDKETQDLLRSLGYLQ